MQNHRTISQRRKIHRTNHSTRNLCRIPSGQKLRDLLNVDLQVVQGQVHNWLDRYFPEFLTVFKSWEGKAAIHFLKLEALPHELVNYTEEELLLSLRQVVKRV